MDFRAYFKHMETSLSLYAYAEKKLGTTIEKYVNQPIEAYVMFSVDGDFHKARCHVQAGGGFSMQVDAKDNTSMYSCIDKLEAKLSNRLRRQKERIKSHKQRTALRFLPGYSPVEMASDEFINDTETVDAAYVINFEKARRRLEAARRT